MSIAFYSLSVYHMFEVIDLRLRELREQQRVSPDDVAAALGCSVKTYLRYENGECFPRLSRLIKMADYFDVTLDDLLERGSRLKSL